MPTEAPLFRELGGGVAGTVGHGAGSCVGDTDGTFLERHFGN